MKRISCISSFIFYLYVIVPCAYPLEIDTHDLINTVITDNVSHGGFALGSYLSNTLLLEKGTFEIIDGKPINTWFGLGGKYEDGSPGCQQYDRSRNHFHNPLTETGFSGFFFGFLGGMSAVNWAQLPDNVQQSELLLSCPGDNYSWSDVRNYFFQGLTSQNNDVRGTNLAKAFRGIGQLMHLVEDMSVPQHVRDDFHVLYNYEKWVDQYRRDPFIRFYLDNPVFPDDSILRRTSAFDNASVPIANLFDTNQYDGTNPNVTLRTDIGLAEYTNANFFSDDTIFSGFPYPSWSQVEAYEEDVAGETRIYFRKLKDVDGQPVEHIAHYLGTRWMYKYSPLIIKQLLVKLDGRVYADYARELIPRAVGYSFQLMKYFLRGALEISPPNEYVYSVIDGGVTPQLFTKIKLKVKNATPYDNLVGGQFQAVAKYKRRTNYLPDLSADPPTADSRESTFSYSVSAPYSNDGLVSATWMDNVWKDVSFDFSQSPIPAGITDLRIMVVYKGTVGLETDTGIAVGMKDLMEPAHHLYFNLTDMFSLNGHLWTADQILASPELSSQVGDGYIYPYNMVLRVGFSNDNNGLTPVVNVAEANLEPGKHFKLIVLTDDINNNYAKLYTFPAVNLGNDSAYVYFNGVANQDNGTWSAYPDPITTFRKNYLGVGLKKHFANGWLSCKPVMLPDSCPYPEGEAVLLPQNYEIPVTPTLWY